MCIRDRTQAMDRATSSAQVEPGRARRRLEHDFAPPGCRGADRWAGARGRPSARRRAARHPHGRGPVAWPRRSCRRTGHKEAIMTRDVFICHSSKDRTIANAICSKLEQNRIRCWIAPRDVLPGRDYAAAIIEAISEATLTMLVFSDNSNKSLHVHREIERTVGHGIPILPLRVDDVVPSSSLEYFISNAHWLDAITPPMEQHLDHVVGTVRLLLDRAHEAAAAATDAAHPPVVASPHAPEPAVETGGRSARAARLCLLYTSPSPRDRTRYRMPSSA